jgi:hypothetical protein
VVRGFDLSDVNAFVFIKDRFGPYGTVVVVKGSVQKPPPQ